MSDEITVSASLEFAKGLVSDALERTHKRFTMTGVPFTHRNWLVPDTAGGTALPLGDVTTPGWLLVINLDEDNFVTILNAVAGNACVKLMPGEFALFRCASAAPAMLADTADARVEYLLLQD